MYRIEMSLVLQMEDIWLGNDSLPDEGRTWHFWTKMALHAKSLPRSMASHFFVGVLGGVRDMKRPSSRLGPDDSVLAWREPLDARLPLKNVE